MLNSMNRANPLEHRDNDRLAWGLAAGVIGVRILHFLSCPPVWCDELWILRNIVSKSFLDLTGTLTDQQAAPPLFLWIERSIWLILGDGIHFLRLPQLLAGCLTVLLIAWTARRCLRPQAVVWAVLLYGLSDPVIDHTCEVKPYVIDACLSVLALASLLLTENWPVWRRLILLCLAAPAVITLSYPGCFVCGAALLALLPAVWKSRHEWPTRFAGLAAILSCSGSFLWLLRGPIRSQRTGALENWWDKQYLPVGTPVQMAAAFIEETLSLLEHHWRPTGGVLIVALVVGTCCLSTRLGWSRLVLLWGPFLLAVVASFLQAYPFESRLLLFCLPQLCLLMAEGLAAIFATILGGLRASDRRPCQTPATAAVAVLTAVLVLWPPGKTLTGLAVPRTRLTQEIWPETARSRGLATTPEQIWALRKSKETIRK